MLTFPPKNRAAEKEYSEYIHFSTVRKNCMTGLKKICYFSLLAQASQIKFPIHNNDFI